MGMWRCATLELKFLKQYGHFYIISRIFPTKTLRPFCIFCELLMLSISSLNGIRYGVKGSGFLFGDILQSINGISSDLYLEKELRYELMLEVISRLMALSC